MDTQKITGTKLRRSERRMAILQGAARAFRENGYDATTIDNITKTATVSKTLVYRHFTTKQEIYEAILQDFSSHFSAPSAPEKKHPNDKLVGFMQLARQYPDAFLLMFRHAAREPQFRQYTESIQTKRIDHISDMLRTRLPNPVKRNFTAQLLCETTTDMLIVWVEQDCPYPNTMAKLVIKTIENIVNIMEARV